MEKIKLISIGLISSILITELILRIFSSPQTTLKFYDNEIFGSALVPNQEGLFVPESHEYVTKVKVNSHGWPDVEHNYEKSDGVFRIVLLGDSFVENFQVPEEKRFFRQLQNELGSKFEIIAIGRGNTGPAQQYLILKEYALKYHPDLVIQMFLTANDIKNDSPVLQNDSYLPYFKVQDNSLIEIKQQSRPDKTFFGFKEFLKKSRTIKLLLAIRQRFQENKTNSQFGYPIDYHVYDQQYNDDYQNAWKVTQKLLLESKNITEASGAKYVLTTLSNNEQVNQKVRDEIFKNYPKAQSANLNFEKPDKLINDFCIQEKFTCWQILPFFLDFEKNNPNVPTHNFYEGHWNQTGTNLATEFLKKQIEDYLTIK